MVVVGERKGRRYAEEGEEGERYRRKEERRGRKRVDI